MWKNEILICISFLSLYKKLSQTSWLTTTHICVSQVLRFRSLGPAYLGSVQSYNQDEIWLLI